MFSLIFCPTLSKIDKFRYSGVQRVVVINVAFFTSSGQKYPKIKLFGFICQLFICDCLKRPPNIVMNGILEHLIDLKHENTSMLSQNKLRDELQWRRVAVFLPFSYKYSTSLVSNKSLTHTGQSSVIRAHTAKPTTLNLCPEQHY